MVNKKNNGKKFSTIAKIAIVVFVLFAAFGAGLLWKPQQTQANIEVEKLKELKQLLQKYSAEDRFDESLKLLYQALQQSPQNEELQRQLTNTLAQKQKYDLSQEELLARKKRELADDGQASLSPGAKKMLPKSEKNVPPRRSKQDKILSNNNLNKISPPVKIAELRRALAEARRKNDSAAVDKLVVELLAENPLDSEANTAKAKRIEQRQGEEPEALEEAERAYRNALISEPEQAEALAGLAQNLDRQNRLPEAVTAYNEALAKLDNPSSELHYLRSVALYRLKNYREAATSFSTYIKSGGQNLRAYYGLGLSYRHLQRGPEAEESFLAGIAQGLVHAATYWELSKLQLAQGPLPEALQSVDKALALKKDDGRYLQTKGEILFQLQRYKNAAETYRQAEESGVSPSVRGQINYNMGLSYYNSSQYSKAEAAFYKAVGLDGSKSEYILGVIDAQIALGKNAAAQKTFATASKKFSGDVDLLLTQGNIYLQAKKYSQALEVFQKAYKNNPQNDKVLNNLGLAYLNTGQFAASRDFFRQAIVDAPGRSNLWFNLALVAVTTEQHEEAISHLEKTLSLDNEMSEAYYLLTKEYLAIRNFKKAQNTLARLRRADPKYAQIDELEKLLSK